MIDGRGTRVTQIGIRHVVIRTDEFRPRGYRPTPATVLPMRERLYPSFATSSIGSASTSSSTAPTSTTAATTALACSPPPSTASAAAADEPLRQGRRPHPTSESICRSRISPPAVPLKPHRLRRRSDAERVARIDAAERYLRETLNERELHAPVEPIGADRSAPASAGVSRRSRAASGNRHEAARLGFRYVTLDLEGFRSGGLNARCRWWS